MKIHLTKANIIIGLSTVSILIFSTLLFIPLGGGQGGIYVCNAGNSGSNMEIRFNEDMTFRRATMAASSNISSSAMNDLIESRLFAVQIGDSDDYGADWYSDKEYILDWYECSLSPDNNNYEFLINDAKRYLVNDQYYKFVETADILLRLDADLYDELLTVASSSIEEQLESLLINGEYSKIVNEFKRYSSSSHSSIVSMGSKVYFDIAIEQLIKEEYESLVNDKFNFNLISTFTILETLNDYSSKEVISSYVNLMLRAHFHHALFEEAGAFLNDSVLYYLLSNPDLMEIYGLGKAYGGDYFIEKVKHYISPFANTTTIKDLVNIANNLRLINNRAFQFADLSSSSKYITAIESALIEFDGKYIELIEFVNSSNPANLPYNYFDLLISFNMTEEANRFLESTILQLSNERLDMDVLAFVKETIEDNGYSSEVVFYFLDLHHKNAIENRIKQDGNLYSALLFIDEISIYMGDLAYEYIDFYIATMEAHLVEKEDWARLSRFNNEIVIELDPDSVDSIASKIPSELIPIIDLNGPKYTKIFKGQAYRDPQVNVVYTPNNSRVSINGKVDTGIPGTYIIEYTLISDEQISSNTVNRTVEVIDYPEDLFYFLPLIPDSINVEIFAFNQDVFKELELLEIIIPSVINYYYKDYYITEIGAYAFKPQEIRKDPRAGGVFNYVKGNDTIPDTLRRVEFGFTPGFPPLQPTKRYPLYKNISDEITDGTYKEGSFIISFGEAIYFPYDWPIISSGYSVDHIKIDNGILIIREYAFSDLNLISLELPESIMTIENNAFRGSKINELIVYGDFSRFNKTLEQLGLSASTRIVRK